MCYKQGLEENDSGRKGNVGHGSQISDFKGCTVQKYHQQSEEIEEHLYTLEFQVSNS